MTSRFEILPFGAGEEQAAQLPEHVRLTQRSDFVPSYQQYLMLDLNSERPILAVSRA